MPSVLHYHHQRRRVAEGEEHYCSRHEAWEIVNPCVWCKSKVRHGHLREHLAFCGTAPVEVNEDALDWRP